MSQPTREPDRSHPRASEQASNMPPPALPAQQSLGVSVPPQQMESSQVQTAVIDPSQRSYSDGTNKNRISDTSKFGLIPSITTAAQKTTPQRMLQHDAPHVPQAPQQVSGSVTNVPRGETASMDVDDATPIVSDPESEEATDIFKSSASTIRLPDEPISASIRLSASDLPVNPTTSSDITPGAVTVLPLNTPIDVPTFVRVDSVLPYKTVEERIEDARRQLEEELKNLARVRMLLIEANDSIHRTMLVMTNLSAGLADIED